MPNYCEYSMKIKGTKDNCNKWLELMDNYDLPNHFFRIFEYDVYDEGGSDTDYFMCMEGECAWSLETCCRASGYSEGVDLFAVNTKELNLKMEAWSQEPGMCFEEHYVYDNGKCLVEDCVNWGEIWWDKEEFPTFEDFKNDCPDILEDVSESDFDENDCYHTDGFENYGEFTI